MRSILKLGIVLVLLSPTFIAGPHAQNAVRTGGAQKETVVTTRAHGTFDVKLNPLPPYNDAEGAALGRLSIDKQLHGDLEATSKGEMLSAGTSVKGSAGYVAMERVTGSTPTSSTTPYRVLLETRRAHPGRS